MATPDGNISKTNIVAEMQTVVRDPINGLSKWTLLGTNNFGSALPYTGIAGYLMTANNYSDTTPLQGGPSVTITQSPQASDLVGSNLSASAIETAFFNAASALSHVRQITLTKTFIRQYDANNNLVWDPVDIGGEFYSSGVVNGYLPVSYSLASGYFSGLLGGTLTSNTDVENSEIDALVTSINNILTTHRSDTVAFTETWCHSSCHNNCHASRNRR